MITVGYFANIREITGTKQIETECEPTLSLLMKKLCRINGPEFEKFCMDGDIISRRVNILVNGLHMLHLQKDETPLKEGDDVRIFPLIGGG